MAQNITLLGASYSDVPSVELPKTGGGTAQFDDTTIASNAASASDITSGKLAFVNGELVTGTASGGGATLITKSITANGTYNASSDSADGYSSVTVNVSGGGGLVYETGTWTPTEDVADVTISFSNTHTDAPILAMICDTSTDSLTANSILSSMSSNYYGFIGLSYMYKNVYRYGNSTYNYITTTPSLSTSNINYTTSTTLTNYINSTGFRGYTNSTTRYWRAGRTYKWIAVWAPTS